MNDTNKEKICGLEGFGSAPDQTWKHHLNHANFYDQAEEMQFQDQRVHISGTNSQW